MAQCKCCKKSVNYVNKEGTCPGCLIGAEYGASPAKWRWDEEMISYHNPSDRLPFTTILEGVDLRKLRRGVRTALAERFIPSPGQVMVIVNEGHTRFVVMKLDKDLGLMVKSDTEEASLSLELRTSIIAHAQVR